MLSEGRIGIDDVFTLRNGILTMYLNREAYERAGLVGKPHGVKGKRGTKPRWSRFCLGRIVQLPALLICSVVELDLTAPSMFPGKKGFDRLIYASQNALAQPITWLFCNTSTSRDFRWTNLCFANSDCSSQPRPSLTAPPYCLHLQPQYLGEH